MLRSTILTKGAISGTTPRLGTWCALRATGKINLQLVTDGTVDGTWQVLASDKDGADVTGDTEGSDITGAFSIPSLTAAPIATVAHGTATTQSQMVQAGPVFCAYITARFTPSAGAGNVSAFLSEVPG
jgi:hypothetical protein